MTTSEDKAGDGDPSTLPDDDDGATVDDDSGATVDDDTAVADNNADKGDNSCRRSSSATMRRTSCSVMFLLVWLSRLESGGVDLRLPESYFAINALTLIRFFAPVKPMRFAHRCPRQGSERLWLNLSVIQQNRAAILPFFLGFEEKCTFCTLPVFGAYFRATSHTLVSGSVSAYVVTPTQTSFFTNGDMQCLTRPRPRDALKR